MGYNRALQKERDGSTRGLQEKGHRNEKKDGPSDFAGQKINAVQIGLGTYGTVIQNLAGSYSEWDAWIAWLLETVSEVEPKSFKAVAVEPVAEHLESLRQQAGRKLPKVRLVQVAIGDEEAENVELHVLTPALHDQLIASVPPGVHKDLMNNLLYLRNMSCVGGPHPILDHERWKAWRNFGVDLSLDHCKTAVWSYGRLARACGFCGCELLLIDAEGHDAKILRSMVQHCEEEASNGRCAWPDLLVFESMGHCDQKEGTAAEAAVVQLLERHGYALLFRWPMDAGLLRREALNHSDKLRRWVEGLRCRECGQQHWPLSGSGRSVICNRCCSPDPWAV